jgi:hypothetical protein
MRQKQKTGILGNMHAHVPLAITASLSAAPSAPVLPAAKRACFAAPALLGDPGPRCDFSDVFDLLLSTGSPWGDGSAA